ncbi:hypothetical protein LAZ67_6000703 [Cordylochernes scorpioides]|uniref:Uncharacterized protein n=1 Tax=Cordylochernes scorpioides TaxID=51811 RepID=A0ABY6KIT8_9ARAC|nr:hypothetical protein LAZ67_6000703 [Cordylochernes scorpioides]
MCYNKLAVVRGSKVEPVQSQDLGHVSPEVGDVHDQVISKLGQLVVSSQEFLQSYVRQRSQQTPNLPPDALVSLQDHVQTQVHHLRPALGVALQLALFLDHIRFEGLFDLIILPSSEVGSYQLDKVQYLKFDAITTVTVLSDVSQIIHGAAQHGVVDFLKCRTNDFQEGNGQLYIQGTLLLQLLLEAGILSPVSLFLESEDEGFSRRLTFSAQSSISYFVGIHIRTGQFLRTSGTWRMFEIQIRELQQDGNFQNSLNEVEAAAWNSFRNVCKNFLGSVKVENYGDIVNDLLLSYKAL